MGKKWYNTQNLTELPHMANTEFIKRKYEHNEAAPLTIYGAMGVGKSAYAAEILAEYLSEYNEIDSPKDWESVKDYIVFRPSDFMEKIMKLEEGERVPAIIWDDAGLWLHALDFNKKFVKWVGKWATAMRSDIGVLILTTPKQNWIAKKVRTLPGGKLTKITKGQGDVIVDGKNYGSYQRIARTYNPWQSPDSSRSGTKAIYEDEFSKMFPDDFYDWYQPKRNKYVTIAKKLMFKALQDSDELSTIPEGQEEMERLGSIADEFGVEDVKEEMEAMNA